MESKITGKLITLDQIDTFNDVKDFPLQDIHPDVKKCAIIHFFNELSTLFDILLRMANLKGVCFSLSRISAAHDIHQTLGRFKSSKTQSEKMTH
jgi:hypothetical protein